MRFYKVCALICLLVLAALSHVSLTTFDINDETWFSINWPELNPAAVKMKSGGAVPVEKMSNDKIDLKKEAVDVDSEVVTMRSSDNEEYECRLPSKTRSKYEQSSTSIYSGPSELALLEPLFKQTACSYKMESYWTYELCHGRHLRQYHEEKSGNKPVQLQEYYLGKYDGPVLSEAGAQVDAKSTTGKTKEPPEQKKPSTMVLEGTTYAYFQVNYTAGTPCDLKSGEPRRASVLYICHSEGRGELYEVTETQSCEYRVVVLSKSLCSHPAYKQKQAHVNKIHCAPRPGSPHKPKNLMVLDADKQKDLRSQLDNLEALFGTETEVVVKQEGNKIFVAVRKKTGGKNGEPDSVFVHQQTTKNEEPSGGTGGTGGLSPGKPTGVPPTGANSLLRQFLGGDYCIVGGSGWWRHELCFLKFARQFHDDARSGQRTVIHLGRWDEVSHRAWLQRNTQFRPVLPASSRAELWQYYSGGDVCDLTGKPRTARIRLRCVDSESGTSISIMLHEPEPCQYILTVEGALLCPLVRAADEDGLLSQEEHRRLMGVDENVEDTDKKLQEKTAEKMLRGKMEKKKLEAAIEEVAKQMKAVEDAREKRKKEEKKMEEKKEVVKKKEEKKVKTEQSVKFSDPELEQAQNELQQEVFQQENPDETDESMEGVVDDEDTPQSTTDDTKTP